MNEIVMLVIHVARCVNCGRQLDIEGRIENGQTVGFDAPAVCPHCGEPLQYDVLGPKGDISEQETPPKDETPPKEEAPSDQQAGSGDSSETGAADQLAPKDDAPTTQPTTGSTIGSSDGGREPAADQPTDQAGADDKQMDQFLGV